MSGTRRHPQALPATNLGRPLRGDLATCQTAVPGREQSAALHTLEHRQGRATSLTAVYDLALAAARHPGPAACAVIVEVDAECLSAHSDLLTNSSPISQRVNRHLRLAPIILDASAIGAIENHRDPSAPDPLENMLRRRLDLPAPVIGRITLNDAVIALLILDRGATSTTPRADRPFVQQIADLTSTAIARILQSFFTDLDGARPPVNHHTDTPLRATALA